MRQFKKIILVSIGILIIFVVVNSVQGASYYLTNDKQVCLPLILNKYPPKVNQIAFVGTILKNNYQAHDIFIVNEDGNQLSNLSNNPLERGNDSSFNWSPSGEKIVFRSNRDDNYEIFIMDADGDNLSNLTNHPGKDNSPTWSPDNQRIAFSSDRNSYANIYAINANGGAVTQLTHLLSDQILFMTPYWSPAGNKISFITTRHDDGDYLKDLYWMNSDGSNLETIIDGAEILEKVEWSPDGSMILLVYEMVNVYGVNANLYTLNVSDQKIAQLTYTGNVIAATWSPSGSQIAYSTLPGNTFIIELDGTNKTELLCNSAEVVADDLAWSPTEQTITYQHSACIVDPDGTTCGIYTVATDGSQCNQIVEMVGAYLPKWRPGN